MINIFFTGTNLQLVLSEVDAALPLARSGKLQQSSYFPTSA